MDSINFKAYCSYLWYEPFETLDRNIYHFFGSFDKQIPSRQLDTFLEIFVVDKNWWNVDHIMQLLARKWHHTKNWLTLVENICCYWKVKNATSWKRTICDVSTDITTKGLECVYRRQSVSFNWKAGMTPAHFSAAKIIFVFARNFRKFPKISELGSSGWSWSRTRQSSDMFCSNNNTFCILIMVISNFSPSSNFFDYSW